MREDVFDFSHVQGAQMSDNLYRHKGGVDGVFDPKTRDVVNLWGDPNKIAFQCPCGKRTVYIFSPPHGIEFDADGLLTLEGSCGFRKVGKYPENWCHFHVVGGVPTMCGDALCPGGGG